MINRKTKIIATIGPSSSSLSKLKKMLDAGMDIVRINMSHYNKSEDIEKIVENLRSISKKNNQPLSILVDICGPKIRVKPAITKGKILIPCEIEITLDYKNTRVHCKHEIILDNSNNIMKLQKGECGGSTNDILFCKITLIHGSKDILTSFVDDARLLVKERIKQTRNKSSDIIRVYYSY